MALTMRMRLAAAEASMSHMMTLTTECRLDFPSELVKEGGARLDPAWASTGRVLSGRAGVNLEMRLRSEGTPPPPQGSMASSMQQPANQG